jgi:hypothetical protein
VTRAHRLALLPLLLTILTSPVRARAFDLGLDAIYMPLGFNLGYTTDGERQSFLLGGELSLVRLWEERAFSLAWVGGYVDATRAGGGRCARGSRA